MHARTHARKKGSPVECLTGRPTDGPTTVRSFHSVHGATMPKRKHQKENAATAVRAVLLRTGPVATRLTHVTSVTRTYILVHVL